MFRKACLMLALLFALPITMTAQAQAACVVGAIGTAPSAALAFSAPTLNTDGTPITLPLTYTVLMGTSSGGETVLATGKSGSPIIVNAGLVGGKSYFFEVQAVTSTGTSVLSNEVCKTFPASTPSTVVITIS